MNVYLNSKEYSLKKEVVLSSFLNEIKIDINKGIAIAINEVIVPKSEWHKTTLNNNDKIILIKAVAGG